MKLSLILILLISLSSSGICQFIEGLDSIKIPVSSELVEDIQKYSNSNRDKTVEALYKIVAPDSIVEADSTALVLDSISSDIDSDGQPEILTEFGFSDWDMVMSVFKKLAGKWYMIYAEPMGRMGYSSNLMILNNFSPNKLFCIRDLLDKGTGLFLQNTNFYKIINNKVCKCLSIVNRAHIYGWPLYINQEISSTFEASSEEDGLWVVYNYRFMPGSGFIGYDFNTLDSVSFIKDEAGISYNWDSSSSSYIPAPFDYDKTNLTVEKISCFGDFGNETLFAKAYAYEIEEKLKSGSPFEIKLLKEFLESLKNTEE